ncbi:MAG: GNAT family N-acetyltransferase [Gaiellaceae bacterium]
MPRILDVCWNDLVWDDIAARLEGRLVALEPLGREHEEGLWLAAQDPRTWRWLSVLAAESRETFREWLEDALVRARAGLEVPFATLDAVSGAPIGSTRYLGLRPEHRSLEIGWTWLAPAAWGSGANVEAKLLLLRRAFEELGCVRVEFKTDAGNERSRAALAALPAHFEGIHRRHMLVRDGERRDSAWYSVVADEWPEVEANLERRLKKSL